jgi:hypothetical protein
MAELTYKYTAANERACCTAIFFVTNFHFSQHYAKAEQKFARLGKGKFWRQLLKAEKQRLIRAENNPKQTKNMDKNSFGKVLCC